MLSEINNLIAWIMGNIWLFLKGFPLVCDQTALPPLRFCRLKKKKKKKTLLLLLGLPWQRSHFSEEHANQFAVNIASEKSQSSAVTLIISEFDRSFFFLSFFSCCYILWRVTFLACSTNRQVLSATEFLGVWIGIITNR